MHKKLTDSHMENAWRGSCDVACRCAFVGYNVEHVERAVDPCFISRRTAPTIVEADHHFAKTQDDQYDVSNRLSPLSLGA